MIQLRYIIAGASTTLVLLLCCLELRSSRNTLAPADVAGKAGSARAVQSLPAVHHAKAPTPGKQVVRPAPANAETSSRQAHRIAAALRSGKTADQEQVFATLLPELLHQDLLKAVRLAETLEPWAWREEVIKCVVREWAAVNPLAAAHWVSRLPSTIERRVAMEQLCLAVAAHEPARAVQIAEHFGRGNRNDGLFEQLISLWAAKDYNSAAQWVARQSNGDFRDRAYARLALLQAEVAPAEAAVLVIDRIAPGSVQTEAAMAVLHQWIRRDLPGAASWVALFPDSDLRRRAQDELAGALRYRSSQSAAETSSL